MRVEKEDLAVSVKCGHVVIDAPHAANGCATLTVNGEKRQHVQSLVLSMNWTTGETSLTTTEYVPPTQDHAPP